MPRYICSNYSQADLVSKRVVQEEEGVALKHELSLEKYMECCVFDTTGAPDRTRVVQLFSGTSIVFRMHWQNYKMYGNILDVNKEGRTHLLSMFQPCYPGDV